MGKGKFDDNRGYSLVELVVVILMLAIIVVALAPQVLKWVDNSRISVDYQNYDTLVSAADISITNENALLESYKNPIELVSTESGESWHILDTSTDWDSVKKMMDEHLGSNWEMTYRPTSNDVPTGGYKIRIENGHVYRDIEPYVAEKS